MKTRLLFLFVFVFATGCSILRQGKIEKPDVKVDSVDVQNVTLTHADLVFALAITNPNAFALAVDEVGYTLKVAGKDVGSGRLDDIPKVPAKGSGIVNLPIKVNLGGLMSSLAGLISEEVTGYELKGDARLGPLKIPFDENGHLTFKNGKLEKVKK